VACADLAGVGGLLLLQWVKQRAIQPSFVYLAALVREGARLGSMLRLAGTAQPRPPTQPTPALRKPDHLPACANGHSSQECTHAHLRCSHRLAVHIVQQHGHCLADPGRRAGSVGEGEGGWDTRLCSAWPHTRGKEGGGTTRFRLRSCLPV